MSKPVLYAHTRWWRKGEEREKECMLALTQPNVRFGEERSNFKLFLVGILDIVGYDHTETENGLEGLKMLAKQNTLICKFDKR